MAISNKTRKILWGRSGNRCAFCQHLLVLDSSELNEESIVADEAHIVSRRKNGPRSHVEIICDHDDYLNLILLCKIHHKLIDDQPETYRHETLILIKAVHEAWVEQTLSKAKYGETYDTNKFLRRINDAKYLTTLFFGSLSFSYDYDPFKPAEAETVGSIFLDSISEYHDMWDELGIGQRIETERAFDLWIKELEAFGYWTFAGLDPDPHDAEGNPLKNWKSFVVIIRKSDNPEIRHVKL